MESEADRSVLRKRIHRVAVVMVASPDEDKVVETVFRTDSSIVFVCENQVIALYPCIKRVFSPFVPVSDSQTDCRREIVAFVPFIPAVFDRGSDIVYGCRVWCMLPRGLRQRRMHSRNPDNSPAICPTSLRRLSFLHLLRLQGL